tara:strand:+ start:1806 stop:2498 length:693 start_codon:yes stop_codon:yes gene_type:complete
MTDLDVTMPTEQSQEHIAPTNNDKRMIDNFQYSKPLNDDFEEEVKEVKEEPELEVKPVISDKVVFGSEAEEEIPSPKPTKKQVASDKQREHLKKAREKALATRRANSAGRKKLEEEKKALRQQKREEKEKALIEKEEQEHQLNQSKPDVKPDAKPEPKVEVKPHSYMNEFSQEQIMELQQQAIENYEVKRKKAKQVKKEAQQKENADKKIYESISKAVGPVSDPWADCFR